MGFGGLFLGDFLERFFWGDFSGEILSGNFFGDFFAGWFYHGTYLKYNIECKIFQGIQIIHQNRAWSKPCMKISGNINRECKKQFSFLYFFQLSASFMQGFDSEPNSDKIFKFSKRFYMMVSIFWLDTLINAVGSFVFQNAQIWFLSHVAFPRLKEKWKSTSKKLFWDSQKKVKCAIKNVAVLAVHSLGLNQIIYSLNLSLILSFYSRLQKIGFKYCIRQRLTRLRLGLYSADTLKKTLRSWAVLVIYTLPAV